MRRRKRKTSRNAGRGSEERRRKQMTLRVMRNSQCRPKTPPAISSRDLGSLMIGALVYLYRLLTIGSDAGHDYRDVVAAAKPIGFLDQAFACALWIGLFL